MANSPHIGTLKERSLHANLKDWVAQPGDQREVKVDGYVIDLVRGDLLIEIQTRSFFPLKKKLTKLTETHPVLLVHPIPAERWITRLAADGETVIDRRKSPKRGHAAHIFSELVSIPHLIERENFTLHVLLISEEEIRCQDGKGSWRRKGVSIIDRRLIAVQQQITLATLDDFRAMLPTTLPDPFTVRDISRAIRQPTYIASKMVYCLRTMNVIHQVGKKGNAFLYTR